ncbi:hypothetical protein [Vibrio fluvialis]|uniref:hypothetical protein n=1 Tax=Vibrio fluvialis TaxID=676 RepID=UPI0028DFCEC4|nr:hypothetical protein [Vibrio fluvialis]MDT8865848.1 hypothetical protein [Vibrio fluvialis]MDT8873616.1 hypothetical protein [Vibrio fluvialis]
MFTPRSELAKSLLTRLDNESKQGFVPSRGQAQEHITLHQRVLAYREAHTTE